jgi:hypothetical protein
VNKLGLAGVVIGVAVGAGALMLRMSQSSSPRPATSDEIQMGIRAHLDEIIRMLDKRSREGGRPPGSIDEFPVGVIVDWGSLGHGCRRKYTYVVDPAGAAVTIASVGVDGKPNSTDDLFIAWPWPPETSTSTPTAEVQAKHAYTPCMPDGPVPRSAQQ